MAVDTRNKNRARPHWQSRGGTWNAGSKEHVEGTIFHPRIAVTIKMREEYALFCFIVSLMSGAVTFSIPSSLRLMMSRSKSFRKPSVLLKAIRPVRPSQRACGKGMCHQHTHHHGNTTHCSSSNPQPAGPGLRRGQASLGWASPRPRAALFA